MAGVEPDLEEIDHLIRNLTVQKPTVSSPHRGAPAASSVAVRPVAPRREDRNLFGRLMDLGVLIPSLPPAGQSRLSGLASALTFPQLPDVRRLSRLSEPIAARVWVGCGVALGIAMLFWPYPKTYVVGLALYLLVLGLVLVSGIWGARLSWDARLGSAHSIAIMTSFWAVVLATAETLPLI
jgi:hypothetical protein